MRLFLKTIKSQESGISLILSMIIMVAIFGLVIAVADVAFDIRASNKSIGSSEVALFAAETAVERTIYEVEFMNAGFGHTKSDNINYPNTGNDASWSSEIQLSTTTPGLCAPSSGVAPSPVCTNDLGVVNNSNPLYVNLENNWSFQLDLDLEGAESFYPEYIYVSEENPSSGSKIIISGGGEQKDFVSPFNNQEVPDSSLPANPKLTDPDGNYKIRIINTTGGLQKYIITPDTNFGGGLPLGLEIRAKGTYLDTERNITLIRPAWLIY